VFLHFRRVELNKVGSVEGLRDERHFPAMQPVRIYAIHIIAKNGRTMLLGVVDSAADRQLTQVCAREVPGVFEVENSLTVAI
jgi:BON domain